MPIMAQARELSPIHDQDLGGLIETLRVNRAYLRGEMELASRWFYENIRHTADGVPFPYLIWEKPVPGKAPPRHGAIEPGPYRGRLPVGNRTALSGYEDTLLKGMVWRMRIFRRAYRPAGTGKNGKAVEEGYHNKMSWSGTWPADKPPTPAWIASRGPSKNTRATYNEQKELANQYVVQFLHLAALDKTRRQVLKDTEAILSQIAKARTTLAELANVQTWLELPGPQRAPRTEMPHALDRYYTPPPKPTAKT